MHRSGPTNIIEPKNPFKKMKKTKRKDKNCKNKKHFLRLSCLPFVITVVERTLFDSSCLLISEQNHIRSDLSPNFQIMMSILNRMNNINARVFLFLFSFQSVEPSTYFITIFLMQCSWSVKNLFAFIR